MYLASPASPAGRDSYGRASSTNSRGRPDGCANGRANVATDSNSNSARRAGDKWHHHWWRQIANVHARQRSEARSAEHRARRGRRVSELSQGFTLQIGAAIAR